jgi:excisionase family DNA binding protein
MPDIDRRDPARQEIRTTVGRRTGDPTLTTSDCAQRLGVTTDFIVDEINDGRLDALVIERPGRRNMYRISTEAFQRYVKVFVQVRHAKIDQAFVVAIAAALKMSHLKREHVAARAGIDARRFDLILCGEIQPSQAERRALANELRIAQSA